MISQLPLFEIYGAMARYAAEAQKVSATNIAHADHLFSIFLPHQFF